MHLIRTSVRASQKQRTYPKGSNSNKHRSPARYPEWAHWHRLQRHRVWAGRDSSKAPVPQCSQSSGSASAHWKQKGFQRAVHKTPGMQPNKVFCILHTKFCGHNVNKTSVPMKTSTFTGAAALRCAVMRTPWPDTPNCCGAAAAAPAPLQSVMQRAGQAGRVVLEHSGPDSRAGAWAAPAGGEAAGRPRLPKASIASRAPARRPAHTEAQPGGTTRPGDLFILHQFFLQTPPVRERQRGPAHLAAPRSRGAAPAAPLPQRVPGPPRATPARPHGGTGPAPPGRRRAQCPGRPAGRRRPYP